jgi:hypothetical protein
MACVDAVERCRLADIAQPKTRWEENRRFITGIQS